MFYSNATHLPSKVKGSGKQSGRRRKSTPLTVRARASGSIKQSDRLPQD